MDTPRSLKKAATLLKGYTITSKQFSDATGNPMHRTNEEIDSLQESIMTSDLDNKPQK